VSSAASLARIRVLLEKELRELVASKVLLATVIFLPTLLTAVAVTMGWAVGSVHESTRHDPQDLAELRQIMGDRIAHFTDLRDALAVYLGEMGLLVILLLPALLPPILASQTLVREKQSRSLETLLVTPVRTWEIVLAKVLFCAGLGVVPLYVSAGTYYAMLVSRCPPIALASLASPGWLLMILVVSPLVAILGVGIGVAVSSRAKDAQTAQQISGMVVLPLVGFLVMQSLGLASVSATGVLVLVGALAILDTVVLALAVALFERETVVTRWK